MEPAPPPRVKRTAMTLHVPLHAPKETNKIASLSSAVLRDMLAALQRADVTVFFYATNRLGAILSTLRQLTFALLRKKRLGSVAKRTRRTGADGAPCDDSAASRGYQPTPTSAPRRLPLQLRRHCLATGERRQGGPPPEKAGGFSRRRLRWKNSAYFWRSREAWSARTPARSPC